MTKRSSDEGSGRVYDMTTGKVCFIIPTHEVTLDQAAGYMAMLLWALNGENVQ